MSSVTCIVSPRDLDGDRLSLSGETFHHLFRVRRLGVDQQLRLVDGLGAARLGTVERIDTASASVRIGVEVESNEPTVDLELWVAPARPQRSTWLVEKATEAGVSAVRWLDSERSGRAITPARLERLQRVAAAAVEQCHRARIPEITGLHEWGEVIDLADAGVATYFLDLGGDGRLCRPERGSQMAVLVGPEGGWTDRERAELVAAGVQCVGLGPRQLRLETAAVVGAAMLLCSEGA